MPANKNALIRYKTIDGCLRNKFRRWTLDDLVEACSAALYECEGISKGVSVRTVQSDIQMMRSDKLGYNAPIEVYEHKYYRYSDPDFSIAAMPLSHNDYEVMQEAIDMLRQLQDFELFDEVSDIVSRLQDQLSVSKRDSKPIVHIERVPGLKGLKFLTPLYNYISHRQTIRITYHSFKAQTPKSYDIYPHMLKEFRNRWFLLASRESDMTLITIALDRVVSIEPIDSPFRDNPKFDPEHYFDNVIGVSSSIGAKATRIVLWANEEQSPYIATKPLHPSQKLIKEEPDGSTFSIEVVQNNELYSTLLSYGPGIKVLWPRSVVRHMKQLLTEAVGFYDI